jgi:hypothetical protein
MSIRPSERYTIPRIFERCIAFATKMLQHLLCTALGDKQETNTGSLIHCNLTRRSGIKQIHTPIDLLAVKI